MVNFWKSLSEVSVRQSKCPGSSTVHPTNRAKAAPRSNMTRMLAGLLLPLPFLTACGAANEPVRQVPTSLPATPPSELTTNEAIGKVRVYLEKKHFRPTPLYVGLYPDCKELGFTDFTATYRNDRTWIVSARFPTGVEVSWYLYGRTGEIVANQEPC